MIWHPRPGQRVALHYRAGLARHMPHEGRAGTVVRVARGPGPVNVEVDLGDEHVVVPRGNLVAAGRKTGARG